jgi:hypothetical protein
MRAYIAYAIIIIISAIIAIQPVMAFNEMGIPFVTSCDFVYMEPFSNTDLTIVEFNSARINNLDFETIDIDFPIFADGFATGPTTGPLSADGTNLGAGSSSNILPFGLVDLAFPSIGQAVLQRSEYERTYFFADTIG